MERSAEVLHAMDVGADGGLGEIAAPQLLNQELMLGSQRDPPSL
jgi:hypothetical protein